MKKIKITAIILVMALLSSACSFHPRSTATPINEPVNAVTLSPALSATPTNSVNDKLSPTGTISSVTEPASSLSNTPIPTEAPTVSPVPTDEVTPTDFTTPTDVPSITPTEEATPVPTQAPGTDPTSTPAQEPTKATTSTPTQAPTKAPTSTPTQVPTKAPTSTPTQVPTKAPTSTPTQAPTKAPTSTPTQAPTKVPTSTPTQTPTKSPTVTPTKAPKPTATPTPTKAPKPTATPTPTPDPNKEIRGYINTAFKEMNLKSSDSMVEKVRKVHDWMVFNFSYDYLWYDWDKGVTMSDAQIAEAKTHKPSKAYWVFENRLAICSGYSAVFKAFMDELGFECITVSSSQMNHAWNMIKMDDGNWYHVDVTWDDPVNSNERLYQWVLGKYRSSHLLRNDSGITSERHYGWTASAPKAIGTKYENEVYHELSYDRSPDDEFYESGRIKKAIRIYSNLSIPGILEFYESGLIAKETTRFDGGITRITEYNSLGEMTKQTQITPQYTQVIEYNADGKTAKTTYEYESGSKTVTLYTYNNAGLLTRTVTETKDGSKSITDYGNSGTRIRTTDIRSDGSKYISEYNSDDRQIKSFQYNADGRLNSESEYNPSTGYPLKITYYYEDGRKQVSEYDGTSYNPIKTTYYDKNGKPYDP